VKEAILYTPRAKRTAQQLAHSLKTKRVALWVFPWKRGEMREGNSENLKHGNDDNSYTRSHERKIVPGTAV